METSELRALLTPEGIRLLDSLPRWETGTDVLRSVADLRRQGHDPVLVAAVLSQSRLRAKAEAKFGDFASSLLFTAAGLEQATRLPVAALHAGRFRDAGLHRVADLGCGIGADALAMAAIDLEVTAVERDEVTAAIASYNLAAWPSATVLQASAEDVDTSGFDALWLDPARRSNAKRLADPRDWSPSLDFAFGHDLPVGVKLGPGLDRDLIPTGAEAQWVSVDRDVVELVVWTGALARPGVGRSALVIAGGTAAELSAERDSPDVEPGDLGQYLYEPDGAVIRARLIGDLARSLDAHMLDPTIAYLTGDALVPTPFATAFRVIERFPLDEKTLKRELAARDVGTLEIKKRGVDIDPAVFRKRLNLRGSHPATLVLTRSGTKRVALLVERVDQ